MTALDDAPLPESPSTPLPPRPRPSLLSPFGWGTPPEDEELPTTTGEGSPLPLPDADGLSASDEWASDETDEWDESSETSSPESSADVPKVSSLVSKHQMRKTAEQAVKIGGGMAHTVGAKS